MTTTSKRKGKRKITVTQWANGSWYATVPALGICSGPWATQEEAQIPADEWNAAING